MGEDDVECVEGIAELKRRAAAGRERLRVRVQVESVARKTARNGNAFLDVQLADAEDSLSLKVWSDAPAFATAAGWKGGEFVEIDGEWSSGSFGPEARQWEARPLDADETRLLLAGSEALRARQAEDFAVIEAEVAGIRDPRLSAVSRLFLERFGERFRRSAGARTFHHARRGGLVEHVARMMQGASAICGVYPELNRDLLIAGVLFHDSGKLWENCYAPDGFTMPYSMVGELLGHIPMGIELVNALWREMMEAPEAADWRTLEPGSEEVRLHLLHLIGAHHGEHAFGSPVLPKTPEAMALHYVDNLDAKMEMFFKAYETATPLARQVFERVRPLPSRLVSPLPPVDETAVAAAPAAHGTTPEAEATGAGADRSG